MWNECTDINGITEIIDVVVHYDLSYYEMHQKVPHGNPHNV